MTYTSCLLGRRWKPIILWKIHEGCRTSAEIRRAAPLISRKMLFQDLSELAADKLVLKHEVPGDTRQTHYTLTSNGKRLLPVLEAMLEWGVRHRPAS